MRFALEPLLRVRQAIYHGLDIDYAIETIMRGYAKPGRGPIPSSGGANYTDDVQTYAYDVEKAKQLLDEAGFPAGPDGIRFKLRHRPAPWGEYTQLWAEYYAQAMKEVGIDVEILPFNNSNPEVLVDAGQAEFGISFQDTASMSMASESTSSLSRGSRPRARHQAISSSPASIGGLESGRAPFQSATQSGAWRRNSVVPKASGSRIKRLPP